MIEPTCHAKWSLAQHCLRAFSLVLTANVWLATAGAGTGSSSLPFEEKFHDYHKGSWRVSDRAGTWRSGRIPTDGCEELVISFDVNQKGFSTVAAGVGREYLKVWYELDGVSGPEPLFFEHGTFSGRVVAQPIRIRREHGDIEVKVEARSEGRNLKYFVDNVKVEAPSIGKVIPRFKPEPDPVLQPMPSPDEASGIERYSRLPGHRESDTFTLEANGVLVPVEALWSGLQIDPESRNFAVAVARFAIDPSASAALDLRIKASERIETFVISPRNPSDFQRNGQVLHSDHKVSGDALAFRLHEPRHLIVKINDLEYLVLLIDKVEAKAPRPGDAEVVHLADYLPAERDPFADVTGLLQRAIDDAAAARKVLYVPDGRYMSGQLSLGSHSHVYLSSGVLIQAIPNWNRDLWPAQAGANDTNKDSSFIFVGNPQRETEESEVVDVKLFGRGVIDGNGWKMRSENDSSLVTANVKLFRSARAANLVVEDLFFRDSARWSFNILGSRDVRFRNVKLVNCLVGYRGNWTNDHKFAPAKSGGQLFHIPLVTNLDAYDIDASTNVLIEDGCIFTGDDAFTPKVTGYMGLFGPCRNVAVQGNLIWTEKAALKLGPEAHDEIANVVFTENYVAHADRFVSALIDGKPGVTISNARVTDNYVETIGGNAYERFFRLRMSHEGAIENLVVDGLDALGAAPQYSSAEGFSPDHRIGPVILRGIRVAGVAQGRKALFGSEPQVEFSELEFSAKEELGKEMPGGVP